FFKDMDIKDIARQTGLSNVNVRVMITRARSTLKKLLKTENL
ncbi:MAG: sigma-70 region 4 domain-containing protein, partial [Bacteroidales bacterium]|nr:sigma-70 region 4 domain-containing protein [Bacteroidales bacterium]